MDRSHKIQLIVYLCLDFFFLSFHMTTAKSKIECGSWGVFKLKVLNLKMKQIKAKHPFYCPHTLRSSSNEEQTVCSWTGNADDHPVQSRVLRAMSKVRCTASEGISSIHPVTEAMSSLAGIPAMEVYWAPITCEDWASYCEHSPRDILFVACLLA